MATSISINTNDTEYGTKKQKSVSYIDPNASNADLVAFAKGMVSLMADTSYESTTRITRTECDVTKLTRTVTSYSSANTGTICTYEGGVYKFAIPINAVTQYSPDSIGMTFNFNAIAYGTPMKTTLETSSGWYLGEQEIVSITSSKRIATYFKKPEAAVGDVIKGTLFIPEDDTYAELNIPFEITVTEGSE